MEHIVRLTYKVNVITEKELNGIEIVDLAKKLINVNEPVSIGLKTKK